METQLKIEKREPEKNDGIIEDAQVIEGTPETEKKKSKQPSYEKTCEECGNAFTTKRQHSRTCSTSCRSKLSKKNKALGNTNMNTIAEPIQKPKESKESKKEKRSMLPTPTVTGLPPHLQMAFDMLKENARRFEDWYEKERDKREALEKEIDSLQDQLREKATSLQGLMDEKPSMFERILAGIPAPIIEQVAPHIGALVGKLSGGMGGTNGQLDEASQGLLNWIEALPVESNQNLMTVFGTLMQLPDDKRDQSLVQLVKLLTEGSAMQKRTHVNVGMFGT